MKSFSQDNVKFTYQGFHSSGVSPDYIFNKGLKRQPIFKFGNFVVSPGLRSVQVDGKRISLGSRAFDLLVLLLSSPGSVVSKHEILDHVWPSTVVEESNLRVQMNQVRKVLGDFGNAIINVPGRGYVFAGEVTAEWP